MKNNEKIARKNLYMIKNAAVSTCQYTYKKQNLLCHLTIVVRFVLIPLLLWILGRGGSYLRTTPSLLGQNDQNYLGRNRVKTYPLKSSSPFITNVYHLTITTKVPPSNQIRQSYYVGQSRYIEYNQIHFILIIHLFISLEVPKDNGIPCGP